MRGGGEWYSTKPPAAPVLEGSDHHAAAPLVGGRTSWCCGVKKRGQTIPPPRNRQSPNLNPLPSKLFRMCPGVQATARLRLRSLELRRRQPPGHRRIVSDRARCANRHAHLLREPGVPEGRLVLIAGLMIAVLVVDVLLLHAPSRGTPDKIDAGVDRQRRDAGARKRKVVRPKKRATHVGLRLDSERLRARGRFENRSQRRAVHAERAHVARRPADVCDIEIQHRGGLAEWNEGPLYIRFAAEQTALFGGGRDEQDGQIGRASCRERV